MEKSRCCNANIYLAPEYYTTNMNSEPTVPMVKVCICCGREINYVK